MTPIPIIWPKHCGPAGEDRCRYCGRRRTDYDVARCVDTKAAYKRAQALKRGHEIHEAMAAETAANPTRPAPDGITHDGQAFDLKTPATPARTSQDRPDD